MTDTPGQDDLGPACPHCGGVQVPKGKARGWKCVPCTREYHQAYYLKRRDELREAGRLNYLANSDDYKRRAADWKRQNREKVNAGCADYYQRNRDLIAAKQAVRYLEDPDRFNRAGSKWSKANPEARRAMMARRRARLLAAICEHGTDCVNAEFLARIYASDCEYCGAPAQHADHFHPLAKGGLHCRENIVPACAPCNASKAARDPIEWLESLTA